MRGPLHSDGSIFGHGLAGEGGPPLLPDGVHPSAEGVRRIVEGLGPQVAQLLARIPA